jgi:TldD protein
MCDRLGAAVGDRRPSGNGRRQSYMQLPMVRMTNTLLAPGPDDPDEIVRSTGRGIYVAGLGGGQVDTTTGDFAFGLAEAYLIENGRVTAPVGGCNLVGNGPDVLVAIENVGSDFAMGQAAMCGKDGQSIPVGHGTPTVKVRELTVAAA